MDQLLEPEGEDMSNLESNRIGEAKAGVDLPDVWKLKIARLGAEPRPDVLGFPNKGLVEEPGADVPGF